MGLFTKSNCEKLIIYPVVLKAISTQDYHNTEEDTITAGSKDQNNLEKDSDPPQKTFLDDTQL